MVITATALIALFVSACDLHAASNQQSENAVQDSSKRAEYEKRTAALQSAWSDEVGLATMVPLVAKWLEYGYIEGAPQSQSEVEMNLQGALCTSDTDEIAAIKQISKTTKDPAQQEVAYYVLARCPILVGDALTSCSYLSKFESKFPSGRLSRLLIEDDRNRLKTACREIGKLKQARKTKDEELYLLGNIYFEALSLSWNLSEVGYRVDYPTNLHATLIRDFPKSKWAGAAIFADLDYFEANKHEGGDESMGCVSEYEDFIARYPASEFVPKARLAIAQHYWAPDAYPASTDEYRLKAVEQFRKIITDYPKSKEAQEAREKITQASPN